MLSRELFVGLLLLAACGSASSSSSGAPGRPPSAVGWTLDIPGERLKGGKLATNPPGSEDRLIPAIPNASFAWYQACKDEKGQGEIELRLEVSLDAVIRSAEATSSSALGDCLTKQAKASTLEEVKLSSPLQIAVRLLFQ